MKIETFLFPFDEIFFLTDKTTLLMYRQQK